MLTVGWALCYERGGHGLPQKHGRVLANGSWSSETAVRDVVNKGGDAICAHNDSLKLFRWRWGGWTLQELWGFGLSAKDMHVDGCGCKPGKVS